MTGTGQRLERLVSDRAERSPDDVAVVDATGHLTFGELERRANRVANALLADGLLPGDRVCLLVPKSAPAIAAILGILKAGGVCVPLDETGPDLRLAAVVRQCTPCRLLVAHECSAVARRVAGMLDPSALTGVFRLGEEETAEDSAPAPVPAGDQAAYILFTSGSTGLPKGVVLTHGNVAHFVTWANSQFGLRPGDRISCQLPLCFDGSLWDVFGSLSAGTELHLMSGRDNLLPSTVADFIRRARLNQWLTVPSVLTSMAGLDVVSQEDFPELRRIFWGGDVVPLPVLRYWMTRLPHVRFTNMYGPTETTIVASCHTLRQIPGEDAGPVPIGTPVPGKRFQVLDADMRPVDRGSVGDLYISGAGLTPAYWRAPALTDSSFTEWPAGSGRRWYRTGDLARQDGRGEFHFHGRGDRQIKSSGHRVELDEVAAALTALSDVGDAAVVSIPAPEAEGNRICAAYVPAAGARPDVTRLRTALAAKLPQYMLPAHWRECDSLPTNVNGKTDLLALRQIFVDDRRK
ncbi:amino acid adenylation domain-containing protein [Streptomyces sp. 110]|uniref:Amino acid adenylation domain-containing protein n=1 Tax=Streptomyces endocoffeicus TaxID=2898945 RepID=A0ABS1PRV1_9ACTN|nr:amino acid adenylation domain-containing protein [Streptomyces endocoffeicus]MBL1115004.1 amino acid adenylation domain-containing protein [Streptomyces endocoffeicus]